MGVAGEAPRVINPYGRRSSSGTYIYFRNHIVEGEYSSYMREMSGNKTILYGVRNDKDGIGYVGIGYIVGENGKPTKEVKILNIAKDENSKAVSPLKVKNVKSGAYPVARPLYQYTAGRPEKGSLIYNFLKFELSSIGENIVRGTGFYPIMPKDRKQNENQFEKIEEEAEEGSSDKTLKIKGSDTELQLVANFAESYSENKEVEITVSGGGSGTGIAALINGRVDIANSSRKMRSEEIEEAKKNGITPWEFIIARDCISIIVHPSNPIDNLTLEEISKIFRGDITEWEEVGGK